MKITYIIALLVIAVGIGIFISSSEGASQYANFEQELALYESGNTNKVHVVGELPKDAQGQVFGIEYNPTIDPNYMAFELIDEEGKKQRVITSTPPPSMADFKRSEKVVVVGRYEKGQFVVSDILLKCPSKYEEQQVAVK